MTDIATTLKERGARYGAFIDNAAVAQSLKYALHAGGTWEQMDADQREALEMIAAKMSRIVTGDPHYADNWHDIVGYARLVEDRLNGHQT